MEHSSEKNAVSKLDDTSYKSNSKMNKKEIDWEERHFQIFSTLLAKHEIIYYNKEIKDEEIKTLLTITDIIIDNLFHHLLKFLPHLQVFYRLFCQDCYRQ